MPTDSRLDDLYLAFTGLRTTEDSKNFLIDLCTPAELAAMADRWLAAKLLDEGLPYRKIYELTGVSTATITRVARCLEHGTGGYKKCLDKRRRGQKS